MFNTIPNFLFYIAVTCCQFDDQLVVSGSADCTVRLWTPSTGTCAQTLTGHKEEVVSTENRENRENMREYTSVKVHK